MSAALLRLDAQQWKPPVGIPMPPFGVTNTHWIYTNSNYRFDYGSGPEAYRRNEHGPYTHYVDNSHPNATDSNNPYGSPTRPRSTWVYPLPAGSAVQLHGGPYNFVNGPGGKMAAGGNGTASLPIFVYGTTLNKTQMPRISKTEFLFLGNWLVVERLAFINNCSGSTRPLLKEAPVVSTCIRDCYFAGDGSTGNPTCISTGGSSGNTAEYYTKDLIILRNEMHGYGNWQATTENDACGIIASQNATDIWVLDNSIYNIGGDSIRIGADQGDTPSGGYYYIGRNRFHHNRENAVDVKQARNAVISENIMYSFTGSSSSGGEVLAVHYAPSNIWVINNTIYDAVRGITSTGVGGDMYVIGNTVYDCSEFGMYLTRGGGTFHVLNNTVANCQNGMVTSGIVDALHFRNNIISDVGTGGYHLQVENSEPASRSTAANFLFHQSSGSVRIRWSGSAFTSPSQWTSATGKGTGSIAQNPSFASPASDDYHLLQTSPAVDTGTTIASYDTQFQSHFGVSMLRDMDGDARLMGSAWDIGADEFLADDDRPSRPQNIRIQVP